MLKLNSTTNINEFEKGPIRRSLFNNGAVSLFHKAAGFSGAVVQLHFIAGSIFESKENAGIAHLIEHLFFKEIKTTLIKDLELAGAAVNAYTYKENVCFELSCNAKKLAALLDKFLDKFFTLDFSDEQLANEKKVIIQELKDDLDDHETQAIEQIFLKNFDYDFGHQVGGSISNVKSFKRSDIYKFYNKFFKPERMILVGVSGVDCDEFEDIFVSKMHKYLKFTEKKSFRIKAHEKSKKINHFKLKKKKKIENALVTYSFSGPSLNAKNYYDFVVLDEILFEGLNSVFFKKLRLENPLIYALGSSLNSFSKCGSFLMIFNTSKNNLAAVLQACKEVFKSLSSDLFDAKELEMIKQRIVDNWELSFDDLEERCEFIAGSEIYELKEFSINHIEDKIINVTPQSLKNTFSTIYKSGFSELVYYPQ